MLIPECLHSLEVVFSFLTILSSLGGRRIQKNIDQLAKANKRVIMLFDLSNIEALIFANYIGGPNHQNYSNLSNQENPKNLFRCLGKVSLQLNSNLSKRFKRSIKKRACFTCFHTLKTSNKFCFWNLNNLNFNESASYINIACCKHPKERL